MNFSPFYCTLTVNGQPREFRVEIEHYEPYDPGNTGGPPSSWYPPDGGYFDPGKIEHRESGARDWETISHGPFLEFYAEHHGLSSLEAAEDDIQEKISEYCEKCLESRYEEPTFFGTAFGYPGEDYYDDE